jgi:hypothetical protein
VKYKRWKNRLYLLTKRVIKYGGHFENLLWEETEGISRIFIFHAMHRLSFFIPLLGIYPKECTPGYDRATCTPMVFAALFIIAKFWKQPICSTTDEWIKKMWYIHSGVLFNHK